MFTWGEGWHNNHHAHPTSSRHGLAWYEIDLNWYGIWVLQKLGLAKQVYAVKLSDLQAQPAKAEDSQLGAMVQPEPASDLLSA
jgi:stearoyl-CoA desaturase (delta-9 desaturase)